MRPTYLVWRLCGDKWPFGLVLRCEDAVRRAIRDVPMVIAWRLPRSIVMWAVIRASTEDMERLHGNGSDCVMEVLKAWEARS